MGAACTGADADMLGFLDYVAQTDLDTSLNKVGGNRESLIRVREVWGLAVDQSVAVLAWKSGARDKAGPILTVSHYGGIISTDVAIGAGILQVTLNDIESAGLRLHA